MNKPANYSKARAFGFKDRSSYLQLERKAKAISTLQNRLQKIEAKVVLQIGIELKTAQDMMSSYRTGNFIKWCRERLGLKKTTAYKYLNVAIVFGNCSHCVQYFDVSALYVLSEPGKVRKEIVEEAVAVAERKKRVTHKFAKRLISEYLGNPAPAPEPNDSDTEDEPEPPTRTKPVERLMHWWEEANKKERKEFKAWVRSRKGEVKYVHNSKYDRKRRKRKPGNVQHTQ